MQMHMDAQDTDTGRVINNPQGFHLNVVSHHTDGVPHQSAAASVS